MPLDVLLRTAAELGIAMLEFGCGNWSSAPHLELGGCWQRAARREFMGQLAATG